MSFENLNINKIILHEVYKRNEERQIIPPRYGAAITILEPQPLNILCNRIMGAIGRASKSMEMEIVNSSADSMVALAKTLICCDEELFVTESRRAADKLAAAQTRKDLPGGILVVFTGTAGNPGKRLVGVVKAETHSGFTIGTDNDDEELVLKFLEDLFLTPQTKLYKIGVFREDDPTSEEDFSVGWTAYIYDDQITSSNKLAAAQYFYEGFLGCNFPQTSAKWTREFHDLTKAFIQAMPISEYDKSLRLNALVTYIKVDNSPNIHVDSFAQAYLPDARVRDEYTTFMFQKGFPQQAIPKDTSELTTALKFRKVNFHKDVRLIAPSDRFGELVEITPIDGEADENGQIPQWTQVTIKASIKSQE